MEKSVPVLDPNIHEGPRVGERVAPHLRRKSELSIVEHRDETRGRELRLMPRAVGNH